MNGSGLGRPGAKNEYVRNKGVIENEQIRPRTASCPKVAFSTKALITKAQIRESAAKNILINNFYTKR